VVGLVERIVMSVDLSKAKIGDKFRTKNGRILEYIGKNFECTGVNSEYYDDKYELIDKHGFTLHFFQYGEYLYNEENDLDLVEQVLDKPLDELIQEATKQFKENGRCSKEGENMKEKCVCEWLREQEYSVNFEDCQEFQFKNAEIVFNKKEDSEIRVNIEYQPSLKTWKIAAYGKNDIVDFSINYCPFCGRKLN
jgi:hypothetical protein